MTETAAWFALQVRPRHERPVAAALQEKEIECLVPLSLERRRWSDRFKTIRTPLFPGYVFCSVDRMQRTRALRTPAAVRIVGFGGRPQPLEEVEVESLKVLALPDTTARPSIYIAAGEAVQLTSGPFAGLTGRLVEARGQRRLIVSVDLLQRSVAVEIGVASVQAVERASWRGRPA